MTEAPANGVERTAALGIPVRTPTDRKPYWHRDEPLVAVTHLDPDHARLRELFPDGWQHLARTKTVMDSVAALDVPFAVPETEHHRRIAPLLTLAASELEQFAATQAGLAGRATGAQARVAADRLLAYAHTGEWKPITLGPPVADEPWLYCGPLSTWAMHRTRSAIGFLLVVLRPDLQPAVDWVDVHLAEVRATAAAALAADAVRSTLPIRPVMLVGDLVLAGGESAFGHKNFAHFFPLEAPNSTVLGAEFTVVFANIHAERLRRCSTALLESHQGEPAPVPLDAVLAASLRWFRCHDLAHFWRRDPGSGDLPMPGLTDFETKILEEMYADTLGLACAGSADGLGYAFTAELFRYLSRRHHHFADSAAAMMTIGWLHERGVFPEATDGQWLSGSAVALAELVRIIHGVLWDADATGLDALRSAHRTGMRFRDGLSDLFRSVPTDLAYTTG
jgi:hypothetical protein